MGLLYLQDQMPAQQGPKRGARPERLRIQGIANEAHFLLKVEQHRAELTTVAEALLGAGADPEPCRAVRVPKEI